MLLTIDENTDNTRLDVYLSDLYEGVSRSKIQNAIKSGKVLVNTQIKKPSYVLKEGDNVVTFKGNGKVNIMYRGGSL